MRCFFREDQLGRQDKVHLAGNYTRTLLRYFKGDTVEEWPTLPVTNGGHQLRDKTFSPDQAIAPPDASNLNQVKVYPNPARDALTVDYSLSGLTEQPELLITDLAGRVIYRGNVPMSQGRYAIDVSNWSMGSYAYNIKSAEKGLISGGVFMVSH